jgi:hypothetical protein
MKAIYPVFVLILISQGLYSEESPPDERTGFLLDLGLGGGEFIDTRDFANARIFNPCIILETRIGMHIDTRLSIFLLTHINIISFSTAAAFTGWIFEDREWIAVKSPLVMFIPFAALFDSELFAGPGVMYHTSDRAPSFFIEGGAGYYSFQSMEFRSYAPGFGFFGGLGVEITPSIGICLRLLFSPSFAHSVWFSSNEHYLSAGILLYF